MFTDSILSNGSVEKYVCKRVSIPFTGQLQANICTCH